MPSAVVAGLYSGCPVFSEFRAPPTLRRWCGYTACYAEAALKWPLGSKSPHPASVVPVSPYSSETPLRLPWRCPLHALHAYPYMRAVWVQLCGCELIDVSLGFLVVSSVCHCLRPCLQCRLTFTPHGCSVKMRLNTSPSFPTCLRLAPLGGKPAWDCVDCVWALRSCYLALVLIRGAS